MSDFERTDAGIASLGVALPGYSLPLAELAKLRGTDPDKYRIGLGCRSMALCGEQDDVVSLGSRAAKGALEAWGGNIDDIGLIAVGTETARDMSRPLSAWIANELNLPEQVRSYEVKHACYGGTLALRQALEWRWAGVAPGKAALVVCSDIALYAAGHPGEPTQGAGAVAMIVDQPNLLRVAKKSYAFSRPAFDFWRPVGEAYPNVDGPLSLKCYRDAVASTFADWAADGDAPFELSESEAFSFHCPFPKMVKKGFMHGAGAIGVEADESSEAFNESVAPSLAWNAEVGNCYTASTWLSVACALRTTGADNLAAFSYGSGCGAELLLMQRADGWERALDTSDVTRYLEEREVLSAAEYQRLRASEVAEQAAE
jgi:hydroxymethylglutaryl-CoA synthase